MRDILMWSGIIIAVVLIISTTLQETKTAPTPSYGGTNNHFKPKGKEAVLNNITKISGFLLFINAISNRYYFSNSSLKAESFFH